MRVGFVGMESLPACGAMAIGGATVAQGAGEQAQRDRESHAVEAEGQEGPRRARACGDRQVRLRSRRPARRRAAVQGPGPVPGFGTSYRRWRPIPRRALSGTADAARAARTRQ